jgi:lipid II:glycine glycyltransferase (peptidoglycan interpeptide bridge formation enzyme)
MDESFLQTKEWARFQQAAGRRVLEYERDGIKANIIRHDVSFGKNYLYIPYGPVIDFNSMSGGFKNPVKNFVKDLWDLGKQNGSIYVKIEPLTGSVAQALAETGYFSNSKKEIQPSKTVVIDTAKDEEALLAAMHHKTRYNIKVAEKHGIVVQESTDVDAFWNLLRKTTARDNFSSHPKNYYQQLLGADLGARLYLAYHDEKPVAGAIVLIKGENAYYLHGGSDHAFRAMMAPYMLHWRIMISLKNLGIKNYDLWGIDAKKWPGVTRFKLGWGGKQVNRPGSFDMPISKIWYLIYKMARSIF